MSGETIVRIVLGICLGVVATVTMDVLGNIAQKLGLVAGAKGQWVGRWYLGIARGQVVHRNITASPEQSGEKRASLIGHYTIGIALAIVYIFCADWLNVSPDTIHFALGFGIVTCVFPWFLVFPALGFGMFGLKGPPELRLFISSLLNHLFYGFGLWWTAMVF